jgi:ribosomal protein S27E
MNFYFLRKEQSQMFISCMMCGRDLHDAANGKPVLFDTVKAINSSGATEVRCFICADCDERERKREQRRAQEQVMAVAARKAMRDNG